MIGGEVIPNKRSDVNQSALSRSYANNWKHPISIADLVRFPLSFRLWTNSLVTASLSLGVEIGVGELLGWGLVKLASEGRVLLGDDEDVDHVDDGETGKGPSKTHDTLNTVSAHHIKETPGTTGHTHLGDTSALGDGGVGGAVVGVSGLVKDGSGNDGTCRSQTRVLSVYASWTKYNLPSWKRVKKAVPAMTLVPRPTTPLPEVTVIQRRWSIWRMAATNMATTAPGMLPDPSRCFLIPMISMTIWIVSGCYSI